MNLLCFEHTYPIFSQKSCKNGHIFYLHGHFSLWYCMRVMSHGLITNLLRLKLLSLLGDNQRVAVRNV